jgi:hypothetical protein
MRRSTRPDAGAGSLARLETGGVPVPESREGPRRLLEEVARSKVTIGCDGKV